MIAVSDRPGDGEGESRDVACPGAPTRDAIVRWSGVACLYAGTAAALACLWSPV